MFAAVTIALGSPYAVGGTDGTGLGVLDGANPKARRRRGARSLLFGLLLRPRSSRETPPPQPASHCARSTNSRRAPVLSISNPWVIPRPLVDLREPVTAP